MQSVSFLFAAFVIILNNQNSLFFSFFGIFFAYKKLYQNFTVMMLSLLRIQPHFFQSQINNFATLSENLRFIRKNSYLSNPCDFLDPYPSEKGRGDRWGRPLEHTTESSVVHVVRIVPLPPVWRCREVQLLGSSERKLNLCLKSIL